MGVPSPRGCRLLRTIKRPITGARFTTSGFPLPDEFVSLRKVADKQSNAAPRSGPPPPVYWCRSTAMTQTAIDYEVVIGLEVHCQILTKSKMFCGCSAEEAGAPENTHVCPVCLGMPGVLPVVNREAVVKTVMTGLALNCTIPEHAKFDRKNTTTPT